MPWHVSVIRHIDLGWDYLDTIDQSVAKISFKGNFEANYDGVAHFRERFESAQNAARRLGWEGDFSEEARVFWLPHAGSSGFVCGFVWKQSHEGKTFLLSPYEIMDDMSSVI